MKPIDLLFRGYVQLYYPAEQGTALFEALRQSGIVPKALKRYEKTAKIGFLCDLAGYRRLCRDFPDLSPEEGVRGGLPVRCAQLLCRPGLIVGLLLAICLTVAARLFIWSVEVTGNEQIGTEELEEMLSAAGLASGSFIPTLDGDGIAVAVRQGDRRISYVTVNVSGTVAQVQIRESVERTDPPTTPADLIATRDGVVTLPLAFSGECLVRSGDVVRAGQVLVSGVIESEKHGPRLTRATGQVLARTSYTYRVFVPLNYEEKVYTEGCGRELTLHFFGFHGIFFKTTGNIAMECDIIKNKEQWTLASGRVLPVGITTVRTLGYEMRPATRTATEAYDLAKAELEAVIVADGAGRTLLERTTEVQADANGITLICTVICEEDIARISEIDVTAPAVP